MKKSLVILFHIGFWFCYLMLVIVILAVLFGPRKNVPEEEVQQAVMIIFYFSLLPSLISFYGFYFWVFPHYPQKKKFRAVVYGALLSLGAGLAGYTLLNNQVGFNCSSEIETTLGEHIIVMLFISFIALVNGVIASLMRGCITWFREIRQKEILKQKNQEMELALVKSQLDPHFLFNTINNIDILIVKDPELASDYLNKLSNMMRFMLYETKTDTISLCKEIEYIEKYIELQKIRTANESYIDFEVNGSTCSKTIAPMVFIPFIENAFKHTTNKKLEKAIAIRIQVNPETIVFECRNRYQALVKKQTHSNGLGNDLIQKRLNLIYSGKHQLNISKQDDLYSVHLTIQHA